MKFKESEIKQLNNTLNFDQINLLRQWFGYIQDASQGNYLIKSDYLLAVKIYKALGMRVPISVLIGAEMIGDS